MRTAYGSKSLMRWLRQQRGKTRPCTPRTCRALTDEPEQANRRKGDWKIVYDPREEDWELFNLEEDLQEQKDLAGDHAGMLKELVMDWEELNGQMRAPIF